MLAQCVHLSLGRSPLAATCARISRLFHSCLVQLDFFKEPLFQPNTIPTLAKLKTSVHPPELEYFIMIYMWEREPCQETHDLCPILIIADGDQVHYME